MIRFGSPARQALMLATAALASLVAVGEVAAQGPVPTFSPFAATYTGVQPPLVPGFQAVADYNGDGFADTLVTDGSQPGQLRLMLGNGAGGFSSSAVALPGTLNAYVIRPGDFNNDGRSDAVVTNNHTQNSTVLINTGNVGNVPQFSPVNYAGGGRFLAVGDLNGDGYADFAAGNCCAGVFVFQNQGAANPGVFTLVQTTSIQPSAGGPSAGPSVITDVNGDGRQDLVMVSGQAGATNIFLGNGNGTVQNPIVLNYIGTSVAAGDLDGDGDQDLVMGSHTLVGTSYTVQVFLNHGSGITGPPTQYSVVTPTGGLDVANSVAIADMNGDGNLDVVTTGFDIKVFPGDGTGALGAPSHFAAQNYPIDVAVADFNADGKPDVGVITNNTRVAGVLLNTTNFAPPDSDGDGVADDDDAFPNDPTETTDSDGDGVGDNADAFDNDPTETTDSDGDGVGDNADAFDNDPAETTDSDGDGVGDNADAFDNDPTETTDSDGDGVGDNADAFDNDPTETTDSDGDGVGDNADAFDNDPTETTDSDGDGVGDNRDLFDQSDRRPSVFVRACGTGVTNQLLTDGATMNDLIGAALGGANHGANVSAVSQLSNGWKAAGLISGRDHGAIVSCTARSK